MRLFLMLMSPHGPHGGQQRPTVPAPAHTLPRETRSPHSQENHPRNQAATTLYRGTYLPEACLWNNGHRELLPLLALLASLWPPPHSRCSPARTAGPTRYYTVNLPTEHIPRAPVTLAPTPPVFPQQHTKGRPRPRPPRLPHATRNSVSNPHGPSRGNPLRQPNARLALPTTS